MQSPKAQPVPYWLTPVPYLIGFVFFLLNSIHLFAPFLQLKVEFLLAGAVFLTALLNLTLFRSARPTPSELLFLFCCLLVVGAPLLTSLSTGHQLEVLSFREYKSWVKMLLIAPALFMFLKETRREELVSTLISSLGILSLVFWYRYGVLGEVREYDLRPLLHMKNGDPNFLCVLFGTVLPLVIYRIAQALRPLRVGALLYNALLFALFLSVILACESRMGLVALAVGLFYLLCKAPAPLRKLGGICFAVFLVFSLGYGGVRARFAQLNDRSNEMRLRTLETGAKLFVERPAFGNGWESAPSHFFALSGYPRLLSETEPLQIHNTFVQLLAELGLYGFLAYGLLLGFTFWQVFRGQNQVTVFAAAGLIILSLNLMTLPLQNKDFVILLAASLAAIGRPFSKSPRLIFSE